MAKQNLKERLKGINIPTPVYFIIAILLVMFFIPREGRYRYTYSENRPWQYSLLTAPFNFHIHKAEDLVKAEKDSIVQSFQPYYITDDAISAKTNSLFTEEARSKSIPNEYITYVTRKLNEIYKGGIISAEDYEKVQTVDKKQLKLKESNNNIYSTRHLASFYTPKQAYDKILAEKPTSLELHVLKQMHINEYLSPNIIYDDKTATNFKDDQLKGVGLYDGMIQSGEKIIDRGELVTPRIKEILDSYTKEVETRVGSKINPGWLAFGQLLMVSLILFSLMVYLKFYRSREYKNKRSILFMLIITCFFPIITGIILEYRLDNLGGFNLLYIIPFAIGTILIRTFIDSRTALTVHITTVLICAIMLPQEIIAEFLVVQIMVGFVCIFSLRKLAERSQLLYCSAFIMISYIIVYTAWVLCIDGDIKQINARLYLCFCINFVFVSFAYMLVYMCERTFGFISEVSMIELSNINRPLLQQLSEVAPGTFQHSMQVSNLVVSAAQKLGANAVLVRTGALYHDIGKMVNPAFFTENQSAGMNPHAGLTEKQSAKIIISHVQEGVKLAKKFNLPQQIIDFIETHHGEGCVKYFYNTYVNKHPECAGEIEDFKYPGPNPFSKEMAILMMADTVEAASRSLQEYTPETISGLVNRLIDAQVADGLFKNAPITFRDIEEAKMIFSEKLITIYHSRIAYPELKKDEKIEEKAEEKGSEEG